MGVDRLRIESNERVDLDDFKFMTEHAQDGEEQLLSSFASDPAKTRKWIVDGFAMTNPAASNLRVTLGRAVLAYRVAGVIQYGALTILGDATKTVDIAGYGAGTYGIYVRFESVAGDAASRIFWNPAGSGSEYSQTVHTRYKANWSVRIEGSNPGDEWTKIGSVDQATMDITDEREFFFEGAMGGIIDLAAVFTWNNTLTIAATGADTSELSVGDWICLKSDGFYFEISAITPNVDVTILNPALRDVPAGATTSAKSAISPYLSGWSTDGGGGANDRSMDRASYPVADFQTAFASLRQAIEDIKGRNLRKWWEKSLGGLNLGFDAEPFENMLRIGDTNFRMWYDGTNTQFVMDDKDGLIYNRVGNRLGLFFNDVEEIAFEAGVVYPYTDDSVLDLGKAAKRWKDLYLGQKLYVVHATAPKMQLRATDAAADNEIWEIMASNTGSFYISAWNDALGASNPGLWLVRTDAEVTKATLRAGGATGTVDMIGTRVGLGIANSGVDGIECGHHTFPLGALKDLGLTGTRWRYLYVADVDVTNDLTARQLNVDGDATSGAAGEVAFTNVYNETLGAVPANFSGSIKIYVDGNTRYLYFFDAHAGP